MDSVCRLGGVAVSVLATGPKGRGFKPGRGDGFLRAIKIRSTSSFRWDVKPEVPCRKILQNVKDPLTRCLLGGYKHFSGTIRLQTVAVKVVMRATEMLITTYKATKPLKQSTNVRVYFSL
jgi:hypothetical protein